MSNTTTYEYSERGLTTQITYADATGTTFTFDDYGNQLTMTNELGKVWSATYDVFNRKLSDTDPLSRTTEYSYDESPGGGGGCCGGGGAGSHLTEIELPSGKKTRFTYDLNWRKTSEVAAYGTADEATTEYQYFYDGAVKKIIDPRDKEWTFEYNNRGWKSAEIDPLSNRTEFSYDVVGNQLTVKRPDNGTTTNVYDVLNRVTQTTDPQSQVTYFYYGGTGYNNGIYGSNLTRLKDARNNSTDFTYDLMNRKTSMIYPDSSHEDWEFDAVGNTVEYTTRGGQVKTCTFDDRNRELTCNWSDSTPDVTMTYDDASRLLTMSSSVSALSYTYNDANEMLTETQDIISPVNLAAKTVTYTYNSDGVRDSVVYPGGTDVDFTYTNRNQLKEVISDGPPPMATYTYDLNGNVATKTLENGTLATYTYDNASRLTNVAHTKSGTNIIAQAYTLNSVGNRTVRSETVAAGDAKADKYAFDAIDQLTEVKYNRNDGAGTQDRETDFAYDAVGNRTAMDEDADGSGGGSPVNTPYTANALNQYTVIDSLVTPAYDNRGNITTLQTASGGPTWTYTYDAQNRLISASGTNGVTASFAYDPRNRCVGRTISTSTLLFLWDGWNLIEERNSSDVVQANYVHGVRIDELIARTDSTGTVYYHQDGLGSTAALTNGSGNLVERYTYDVYGQPSIFNSGGTTVSASAYGNRFLYTGREWLAYGSNRLDIYDYRNRVYSPQVGRFLQTDPLKFEAGDVNIYRYVGNAPTLLMDPFGLEVIQPSQFPLPLSPAAWQMAQTVGCVGLCQAIAGYPKNQVQPQYRPNVVCYKTEAQAKAHRCDNKKVPFLFAVQGAPTSGYKPVLQQNPGNGGGGTVSNNSIHTSTNKQAPWNYASYVQGSWYMYNNAGGPLINLPSPPKHENTMYCVDCLCPGTKHFNP